MPAQRVRIVIADAHPITREGLRISLEREAEFSVVGEAQDGQAAALAALSNHPDIIILDSALKRLDSLTLVGRLRAQLPGLGVLVTFPGDDPVALHAFAEAGVCGFLTRMATPAEYTNAVHTVLGGGTYLSNPLVAGMLGQKRLHRGLPGAFGLTAREIEILRLICDGYSNKEVARRLDLSVRTVETHRLNIRKKTNATRLHDLVNVARQIGLGDRVPEVSRPAILRVS